MDDVQQVLAAAHAIAAAIGRKDAGMLADWLAPGFIHRMPGRDPELAPAFLEAIRRIPGDILFVRLESVAIDLSGTCAVVTGIQHAQLRLDGSLLEDKRPFVDWFVKVDGEWRIRLAVELGTD